MCSIEAAFLLIIYAQCRTAALKEDIDSVVNRHQKMQDEIAEDMIRMAHSLKNNSLVAKEIMLSDNKVQHYYCRSEG